MFKKFLKWLTKPEEILLLCFGGPCHKVGDFIYSDRYPKPFGLYRITTIKPDNHPKVGSDHWEAWGILIVPIVLARCNVVKVQQLLNDPHCSCDPKWKIKDYHEETFKVN